MLTGFLLALAAGHLASKAYERGKRDASSPGNVEVDAYKLGFAIGRSGGQVEQLSFFNNKEQASA